VGGGSLIRPSADAREDFRGNTQKIDCRLQGGPGKFLLVPVRPRTHGPDKAGARQQKEVIAVMNINVNFGQHADLGMPVFGRVRVASLRAFPMTTGAVKSIAGQKCALMDQTQVLDGYRVVAGLSVATGAFPGIPAWSPPI